jgi:hypothetical protein
MSASYVRFSVCLHGIDAGNVKLRHDEVHGALYVELDRDRDVEIRIQLTPHVSEDPEQFAAGLERDRQGLLHLSELATEAAVEIEQMQQEAGR